MNHGVLFDKEEESVASFGLEAVVLHVDGFEVLQAFQALGDVDAGFVTEVV